MQSEPAYRQPPARHPLRRRFPDVVTAPRSDDNDLKLFALSFTAFFIVIYSFIA